MMTPLGREAPGGGERAGLLELPLTDALITPLIKPRVTSAGTDPPLPAPAPRSAALPLPAAGSCLLVPVANISLLLPLQESSRGRFPQFLIVLCSLLTCFSQGPLTDPLCPPNNVERDCLRMGGSAHLPLRCAPSPGSSAGVSDQKVAASGLGAGVWAW